MGKLEEEHQLPSNERFGNFIEQNANARFGSCTYWLSCCEVRRLIGLRCLLVLLFSMAAIISFLFWLPPFSQSTDQRDLDLDDVKYRDHEIVASFNVEKSVQILQDNILLLQDDIFDEIGFPTTKVVVLSLEPSAGSNITKVVFSVDSEVKGSRISATAESLIRASFLTLVVNQSHLQITTSILGEPFLFEVLKFPRGIIVTPPQHAFLMQKVQILFNFTLNFSIYQIQVNFDELKSQLKSGLHLAPYENLYVRLSNSKGSTVSPPTTVQSSVLLAVGITPSVPRLKQLAQTITDSHSRNLGLNNTVFGRVKEVQLSSILQHSLHGDGSGGSPSPSPSPAPLFYPHHHDYQLAPAVSPTPAHVTEGTAPPPYRYSPAPSKSFRAKPPGCQYRNYRRIPGKGIELRHLTPEVAPFISPRYAPQPQVHPPASVPVPVPSSFRIHSPSSLPNVAYAHVQPPLNSNPYVDSGREPSASPSPPSSSASAGCHTAKWSFLLFLPLVLQL